MTTILNSGKKQKNSLSISYNVNKYQNLNFKNGEIPNNEDLYSHNFNIDKYTSKKLNLYQNTSNKKLNHNNKISIVDFENNSSILQSGSPQNSKILLSKSNISSKNKKCLIAEALKDKNSMCKLVEKKSKVLKNVIKEAKLKSKNRNMNLKRKVKNITLNDSNIHLLDIDINKKNDNLLNKKINKYKIAKIKNNKNKNISSKTENEILKISFYKDKESPYKEDTFKKTPYNDKIFHENVTNSGKVIKFVKKQKINKSLINKTNNTTNHKKIINFNEFDKNKKYINIINNFDIINIINIKEKTKKLSTSISSNTNLNNTTITKSTKKVININGSKGRNIIKVNNTKSKNIDYLNYINLIKKSKNKENDLFIGGLNTPKSIRKKNYLNNDVSSYTEKYNKSFVHSILNNANQNKWDKKCFVPIVSASLIKGDEIYENIIKSDKKVLNENINISCNNYNSVIRSNRKYKRNNFFDNNKKKRELLFNFIHKKMKSEAFEYLNVSSKRTRSFIYKRNKHITERYNSFNKLRNSNIDYQAKQLDEIHNEIINNKMNNICTISVDNIYNYNFKKNKSEEKNKKYKRFKLKVKSMNTIKKESHANFKNIIVKRGELLNKLRNIKRNYSSLDKDKDKIN